MADDPWAVASVKPLRGEARVEGGDEWAVKSVTPAKRKRTAVENVTGFMANVNRGLGIGDEMAAGFKTAGNVLTGQAGLADVPEDFRRSMASQRQTEDDYMGENRLAANLGRGAGMATGALIPVGATVGSGNALMAGARGATAAAASGYAYGMADRGNLQERVKSANVGAATGAVVGGALGAGAHALAARPSREARNLRRVTRDAAPDQLRANRDQIRADGFQNPTLTDVVDESGRGTLRAAASRQTPAREATREFVEGRTLDLPDRVGRQARTHMSPDPRTPDEIAAALGQQRSQRGNVEFGAVRDTRVPLSNDAVMALRTNDGRSAIRDAAAASGRSMDPNERATAAELNRLADEVLDAPGQVQVTVGMSQSISEALLDAADAAHRQGRNRMARSLGDLGRAIRENARTQVPGYDDALRNFATQSGLMEAGEVGEGFLRRNTDEFVAATGAMSPEQNQVARATGRRAIERAVGENPSSAPGVARRLANAPEQQARNNALLGPQAEPLQNAMRTEARMVQNAQDISPRAGSQTALRMEETNALAQGAQDAMSVVTGGVGGVVRVAINRLKTAGLSDRDAQHIVEIAIDPTRLDEALALLEPRLGAQEAARVLQQLRAYRAVGVGGTPRREPAVEAYVEGRPDAYGAAY